MSTMFYLVMGEQGEYSDWQQWPVCAYHDEDSANRHAAAANARNKEIADGYQERAGVWPGMGTPQDVQAEWKARASAALEWARAQANPYDPSHTSIIRMYAVYSVFTVPMLEAVP